LPSVLKTGQQTSNPWGKKSDCYRGAWSTQKKKKRVKGGAVGKKGSRATEG